MTKIKIDIDSDDKITNASVNIIYANGIEESRDVVVDVEPSQQSTTKQDRLIKETDKKIIIKSGVNNAFKQVY